VRYKPASIAERDSTVERLREFIRLNYVSAGEVARRMGFRDETVYSWLKGDSRPAEPELIIAFLNSLPAEESGISPTGYEYREYKNWRGIPKPRRCAFCKQAKGEIRKVRGGFQGVCPNCGATGPKRENYDVVSAHKRSKSYRALFSSLKNSKILSACSLVSSPLPSVHPVSVCGEIPRASATLEAFWVMMSR
jgi:hypothetical protein